MQELISIIVPIYEVEQFLCRCIDSLLAQTYTNYELILVDDGSPDRCGDICDEYAQKDKRIKVVHKENGGLSDARNVGIAIASGDYIAFVDSDDWVTPNYLSCLLETLKETASDICESEILYTSQMQEQPVNQECKLQVYETEEALKQLISDKNLHQYVWNKLYKRCCIEGISFAVGKTNEDEFWTYQVFGKARKVVKTSEVLYFYFQREGSIMGTGYNLRRLDALEAKQQRQCYIEKNFPSLAILARNNLFGSCIYSGQMSLKYLKGEQRKQAKMRINRVQRENRPKKEDIIQLSGSEKLWMIMARMSFWMTCKVKNLLRKGL